MNSWYPIPSKSLSVGDVVNNEYLVSYLKQNSNDLIFPMSFLSWGSSIFLRPPPANSNTMHCRLVCEEQKTKTKSDIQNSWKLSNKPKCKKFKDNAETVTRWSSQDHHITAVAVSFASNEPAGISDD